MMCKACFICSFELADGLLLRLRLRRQKSTTERGDGPKVTAHSGPETSTSPVLLCPPLESLSHRTPIICRVWGIVRSLRPAE